jgi:hypothetical protein
VRYECPVAGCEVDVTDEVRKARDEQRLGAFRTFTFEAAPEQEVLVTCVNGHLAAYPASDP